MLAFYSLASPGVNRPAPEANEVMATQMPSSERFKDVVRQEWSDARTIAAWRKWERQHRIASGPATRAIREAAQVRPGMQVLDLASGSGEPALSLAEAVGPGGHVTATDLVPEMLALAEEGARERALRNIAFRQADAEALPFPDRSFDAVTCRFGIMYWPNVARGLREVRRLLRPGGRATFIAPGPFEQNPYFTTTIGVFRKYVQVPPPEPGAPDPFRFSTAGTLSAALREAAFHEVHEESRTIPWQFPGTAAQVWEYIRDRGAPFRRLFESLAPERRERVGREVLAAIRQYDDGQQVSFPFVIVLASAVNISTGGPK